MDSYGKLIAKDTLQFKRILPGPIERVWEYLVDDEKRGKWFAGGPTDLVPDGKMELIFHNSTLSASPDPTPDKYKDFGDGFKSFATIVKVEKPTLLVINWEDGVVSFELKEQAQGKVKLTLTHEKLQKEKEYRVGVFAGWHTHVDILTDILEGREVQGFWKAHMKLEEEYSELV